MGSFDIQLGKGKSPSFLLWLHTITRVLGSALLFLDNTGQLELFGMSEAPQAAERIERCGSFGPYLQNQGWEIGALSSVASRAVVCKKGEKF